VRRWALVDELAAARTGRVGDGGGGVAFRFLLTPGGAGCDDTLGAVRGDLAGEGYGTEAILAYRRGGEAVLVATTAGGGGQAGVHWRIATGSLSPSPSAGPKVRRARTVASVTADLVLFAMAVARSALVFCGAAGGRSGGGGLGLLVGLDSPGRPPRPVDALLQVGLRPSL